MKFLNLMMLVFLATVITLGSSYGQEKWTYEDRQQYAAQQKDTSLWDMKMFAEDLEFYKDEEASWPIAPAISEYPSPVPEYDWGSGYIANLELTIDGKVIEGKSIGFAKDKYRQHLFSDTSHYYLNYFNIFILSDLDRDTISSNAIVSRNYPHYLSTGKTLTSKGAVDWLHLSFPNGENMAVVAQRYFDLEFGKTILVAPLQDGSIRILQVQLEIGSLKFDDLRKLDTQGTNKKLVYIDRLKRHLEVVAFFGQKGI